MVHTFRWRGGSGKLSLASDWINAATGHTATLAPGKGDTALITGPAAGMILLSGALSVAALSLGGTLALAGRMSTGTLKLAGLLAVSPASALIATARAAVAGTLDVSGLRASASVGALTLSGTVAVAAGASVSATGVVLQGGTIVLDATSTLTIGRGTAHPGTLVVAPRAALRGHGRIDAAVNIQGVLGASGGALGLFGYVNGRGTLSIGPAATLFAAFGVSGGLTATFSGTGGTLELFTIAARFGARITGFAAGDAIDIASADVTAASWRAGKLTLTAAGGKLVLSLPDTSKVRYDADRFVPVADGLGGTAILLAPGPVSLVPCFVAGTRIATPEGEVPVEALRVGDVVLTPHGPRALRWVAHRSCVVTAAAELRPVRIAAGALLGLPRRDLLLSPQHALLLGGVLVPAVALLNGRTVTRSCMTVISYHHIACDIHTTVLADGAAAETYLPLVDAGAAALFDREAGHRPPPATAPCARRLEDGVALAAIRARLFGPPPRARRAPGPLLGHLERAVRHGRALHLEGWALDGADPSHPVELEVLRGGRPAGIALANRWRPDLDHAGLADGCCAFGLRLRATEAPITLRRRHDGAVLPNAAG